DEGLIEGLVNHPGVVHSPEYVAEIDLMREGGIKLELEALSALDRDCLRRYVSYKAQNADYI
ncbi:hypothetical protein SARC_12669, partial [Sphaeroforma arctica JP610]